MALTIATQMAVFALLLLVGAGAAKFKVVKQQSLTDMIDLVLKVLLPTLVFSLMYERTTRESLIGHLWVIPITACFYVAVIAVVTLTAKLCSFERNRSIIFQMVFIFGNTGFIGLPLLVSVLPETGVVNLAMFLIVDQLVIWTYGVSLAASNGHGGQKVPIKLRNFLNPNIIALMLAFVFVLTGLKIPIVVETVLSTMASAASPLCLICLGALCYLSGMGTALRGRELYIGVMVKMIVLPLIGGSILKLMPLPADIIIAATLMMAMPATTTVPMLVRSNGGDDVYATNMTVATIALSVATVPLVSFILGF